MFHSFSSPTYQLASKGRKFNKKEAPLVDPEPTSDISNFNTTAAFPSNSNGNVTKSDNYGTEVTKAPLKSIQGIHSSAHGKCSIGDNNKCVQYIFKIFYFRFNIKQSINIRCTM